MLEAERTAQRLSCNTQIHVIASHTQIRTSRKRKRLRACANLDALINCCVRVVNLDRKRAGERDVRDVERHRSTKAGSESCCGNDRKSGAVGQVYEIVWSRATETERNVGESDANDAARSRADLLDGKVAAQRLAEHGERNRRAFYADKWSGGQNESRGRRANFERFVHRSGSIVDAHLERAAERNIRNVCCNSDVQFTRESGSRDEEITRACRRDERRWSAE